MKINFEEVNYIAKLAKLKFTEEEAKNMAEEFEAILSYFESIDRFDLSHIDLSSLEENPKSVLRRDEVSYFEDKTKLFQNVKCMSDTSIKVPKILE